VTGAEELELILQTARLYYEANQTQREIAEQLEISRSTVSRLLGRARDLGIVQISVHDPLATHTQLEEALVEHFGLRAAVVAAQTKGLPNRLARKRVGQAAARYLCATLQDGDLVGMGWGRTLYETVEALEGCAARALIDVTPLLGGVGQIAPSFQVNHLAGRLAQSLGGTWHPCFAPAILGDQAVYDSLVDTEDVGRIVQRWDRLDSAIVGIGNTAFDSEFEVLFVGYLDPDMKDQLRTCAAVGDICMRFFTLDGSPCSGGPSGVLGVSLEQIRSIPRVIGVAGGGNKIEAILGAIRGGYIKVLITNETTATGLLEFCGTDAPETP
jgi:deoxyribonucleoside regulator